MSTISASRSIGGRPLGQVGYGLMSLTLPWAPVDHDTACRCLKKALQEGANLWNGGIHYGTPTANSLHLLRHYFEKYPEGAEKVVVSIKGALGPTREPTGIAEAIRASVEEAYRVLKGIKTIDIFEMARVDPNVSIETSIRALAELVAEGKIGGVGLSEVDATTIRKANAVHEISAVEIELSLFTPDPIYNGIMDTCAELGIPVAAYSPLGRGLLTGTYRKHSDIPTNDFRHILARFKPEAFEQNAKLIEAVGKLAQRKGMTPAQLALAWVVRQGAIPIPGSSKIERVEANCRVMELKEENWKELESLRKQYPVAGERQTEQLQMLEEELESMAHALISEPNRDDEVAIAKRAPLTSTGTVPVEETNLNLGITDLHATPTVTLRSSQISYVDTLIEATASFTDLSQYEVQILLDRYNMLMVPHMPFVSQRALPTTASSNMSSLLLKAVVTVAYFHDAAVQKTLVEELIQCIISRIFTDAEKSLELLQALLVLCAWYNPHIFTSSSHASLLHMCMALTTDLAINRDPTSCEMAHMASAVKSCGIPETIKTVNDEERRAVLGVFWVMSTVFTSFRKTDVPNWTPRLQKCLETLKKTALENDRVLVALVQSQKIMHQAVSQSLPHSSEALQTEIDDNSPVGNSPANSVAWTLLSLQRECARIATWEPSFLAHNLEGIWFCISALTSYLTLYNSIPVSSYLTVPFTVFAQFAYVFVVMVRASPTHFDGFDGTLL
ncbi:Pyridoxine 4-dehydrogenase [Didymella heteroderae]|uniref:Pyridoxine 4-dehydrogenase n=1 Tax=Didymella heteroderae TaxID=1769908 RepID=A0A9P4WNU2_9PLEO|nr:Pyridoxine 4-dehydrogenase [Didymella heteroderae]